MMYNVIMLVLHRGDSTESQDPRDEGKLDEYGTGLQGAGERGV